MINMFLAIVAMGALVSILNIVSIWRGFPSQDDKKEGRIYSLVTYFLALGVFVGSSWLFFSGQEKELAWVCLLAVPVLAGLTALKVFRAFNQLNYLFIGLMLAAFIGCGTPWLTREYIDLNSSWLVPIWGTAGFGMLAGAWLELGITYLAYRRMAVQSHAFC